MGIQGLLPFLKKASREVNVSNFAGATVAVDAHCWLHKGAFSCAEKLGKGETTDGYVQFCVKMVNSLLAAGVTPILVFDGRHLPAKSVTNKRRQEIRAKNRQLAKKHLLDGNLRAARECFQRCVEITPEMALQAIRACRKLGVDCIVAPYEADAQLAYLNKSGIAQIVITEDSDLILFGCDKILYKMDVKCNGILLERSKLHLCLGVQAEKFTFDKFRHMCILSGCDYLPSLPGIGLGKSYKFFSKATNPDLNLVMPKIPYYLKMPNLVISEEYKIGFIQADNTFLYQLVFDAVQRKMVPLNPYPPGLDHETLDYAGKRLEDHVAFQIALGNINVQTMQTVDNFEPEISLVVPRSSSWSSNLTSKVHISIWSKNFTLSKHVISEKDNNVNFRSSSPTVSSKNLRIASVAPKRIFSDPQQSETSETPEPEYRSVKRMKIDSDGDSPSPVIHSRYFQPPATSPGVNRSVEVSDEFPELADYKIASPPPASPTSPPPDPAENPESSSKVDSTPNSSTTNTDSKDTAAAVEVPTTPRFRGRLMFDRAIKCSTSLSSSSSSSVAESKLPRATPPSKTFNGKWSSLKSLYGFQMADEKSPVNHEPYKSVVPQQQQQRAMSSGSTDGSQQSSGDGDSSQPTTTSQTDDSEDSSASSLSGSQDSVGESNDRRRSVQNTCKMLGLTRNRKTSVSPAAPVAFRSKSKQLSLKDTLAKFVYKKIRS